MSKVCEFDTMMGRGHFEALDVEEGSRLNFHVHIYKEPTLCNLTVCLLVAAILLYMFRTLSVFILRIT